MPVHAPKPLIPLPLPMKDEGNKYPMWQNHPEPVQLPEGEKRGHLIEQKDELHTKIGPYGM